MTMTHVVQPDLNLAAALDENRKPRIGEMDYLKLSSLKGCLAYL